ncbi:MAG: cytochrome P450 [Verrucomicrobiales bacterium]
MIDATFSQCPAPLNMNDPEQRKDPYPVYRWYRENDPVHLLPHSISGDIPRYMLTRWDDVMSGLKNLKLRMEVHKGALWNRQMENVDSEFQAYASILRTWPLFRDPPNHAEARRPVNRILDEAMTEAARPLISGAVEFTLDRCEFSSGWQDLVQDFTNIVPLETGRRLFGLQSVEPQTLSSWLQSTGLAVGNVFNRDRIRAANESILHLQLHLGRVVAECREGRADAPMVTRILEMEANGLLEDAQVVPVCILLLQAAQDSVIGLLGSGVITFLRNPDQLAWSLEHDDGFNLAVDEVIRFESPVQQITRHAAEVVQIRDKIVQPGEGVSFLLGAANRDPEIFESPDEFVVNRPKGRTAAFGHGPHMCPGIELGKEIASAGWAGLFRRYPRLEHDEAGATWRPSATFRILATLPVRAV